MSLLCRYDSQINVIGEDYKIEYANLDTELIEKREKLKDTLLNEQRDENRRHQSNVSKLEIDATDMQKRINEYMETNFNKPAKNNASNRATKAISTKIVFSSIVTTRSKKKQLVPKLRPRLNGRASTSSPVSEKGSSQANNNNTKNNVKAVKSSRNFASLTKVAKEKSTPSVIHISRKSKATTIENKLKIKFMLDEDEIDEDLRDLTRKLI